jgi:hypothetical protein
MLEHKDRSTGTPEPFKYGWEFLRFKNYKEGTLSLVIALKGFSK